jgi:hypothetical protein
MAILTGQDQEGDVMQTNRATTAWRCARRRSRGVAIAVAVLTALLVSGCGAGQQAQTSRMVAAIPGVDADAGPIALRDLLVPYRAGGYPGGSDVPLVVRLINTGEEPVTVTRVTPGPGGYMLVPARHITVRATDGSGSRGASRRLVVPPGTEVALVPGSGPYLMAEHVKESMGYDAALPVRFTFSTGQSVVVDVPMAPPTYPVAGPLPSTTGASPGALPKRQ